MSALHCQQLEDVCVRMHPDQIGAYFCYDPRDPSQSAHDRSTWKLSENAILITATMLLVFDAERSRINWERVAALADLCEGSGFHPVSRERSTKPASRSETDAMLRAALRTATQP
jgi:hypothetical protein